MVKNYTQFLYGLFDKYQIESVQPSKKKKIMTKLIFVREFDIIEGKEIYNAHPLIGGDEEMKTLMKGST